MHATPTTIVAEELNKICITRKGKEKKNYTQGRQINVSDDPWRKYISIYVYLERKI